MDACADEKRLCVQRFHVVREFNLLPSPTMDTTIVKSLMRVSLIYGLFLSNFGVTGFFLRSCYLLKDSAICSQKHLTEVPTDLPPTVRSIDLSNNNISNIQLLNFTHFPYLTKLDLHQNSISNIEIRCFSKLKSLKILMFSKNALVKLEDEVFDGLSKLEQLRIDSNRLASVSPKAFISLSSLTLLDLSSNNLGTIAQVNLALQQTPRLTTLIISNNGISTVRSQDLANTSTMIKFLDVSENPLTMFEVTTGTFSKLNKLTIGDHTVRSNLSWVVQKRSSLKSLSINAVELNTTDDWKKLFTSLIPSLRILSLNWMQSRLPALINMSCSILKLQSLQLWKSKPIKSNVFKMCEIPHLDLESNDIEDVGNYSFFCHLRALSLSKNKLTRVPFAIRNLQYLGTLKLAFNQITTLGCQDFAGLSSLRNLDLQGNRISELGDCTFVDLLRLEELKLQSNVLLTLGKAFQSSLPNLKVLSLNENRLTAITENAFIGLHSLTKILLGQNQIKTLEPGCFSGLTRLNELELHDNNLNIRTLNSTPFRYLFNLTKLNLENNHIKYAQSSPLEYPPFINLSRLQTLKFSVQHSTGRSIFPLNFLQGLTNLNHFFCNNIHLLNFSDDFFSHTPHLISLDMGSNDLSDISTSLFVPIPNLVLLRLTSTNLRSLDFLIHANLTKLQQLLVRKNTFSVISEDVIHSLPSLKRIELMDNNFACDCDNAWFVQWIKKNNQTQVTDAQTFRCNSRPLQKNTKLLDLNVQSCFVDVGFICFISSSCLNILILVASFTYHFSRFQLIYAYYIFLAWLFEAKNKQKRAECRYDAFVSYNSKDEAWVYGELVPHLEQEQGWTLCLHHRDFLPGKPIVENIAEAIYESRKTICVISHRYLQSEWCSKEMQLASFRLFDECEDVLILLFLEDIPLSHLNPYYRMKRLLKKRTYLSWTRANDDQPLFWEKLRQALRSTNTAAEDRLRLTVVQDMG